MKTAFVLAIGLAFSLGVPAWAQPGSGAPVAGKPGATLQKIDTKTGAGKTAQAGSMVSVNYTGWLYMPSAPKGRGQQIDSSPAGEPFTFRLGAGRVIPGWDQGVAGMKVGGRRTLVVPAELGYGKRGIGPIPPGANLIFDIELVGVK